MTSRHNGITHSRSTYQWHEGSSTYIGMHQAADQHNASLGFHHCLLVPSSNPGSAPPWPIQDLLEHEFLDHNILFPNQP